MESNRSAIAGLNMALRDQIETDIAYHICATVDRASELLGIEQVRAQKLPARRRATFSSGRYAIRRALASCGAPQSAIGWCPEGRPLGPCGWSVSIAHTDEVCFAVCADAALFPILGADIERTDEVTEDLSDVITRPAERAAFRNMGIGLGDLFVLKEASFKALSTRLPPIEGFSSLRLAPELRGMNLRLVVDVDQIGTSRLPPLRAGLVSSTPWTACVCYADDK